MDTSRLASHCIDLLRSHNRVSLGNMGSFMAEDTPATLTHDSHVLNPPGRRICFRENETWNDGLLEDAYGSKEELEDLISDVSRKLAREKSVTLDGFGKLRRTREGDIFFVMDKNVSVNPNGFGLVPLSLSPLPSPSKVKCELALPTEPVAKKIRPGKLPLCGKERHSNWFRNKNLPAGPWLFLSFTGFGTCGHPGVYFRDALRRYSKPFCTPSGTLVAVKKPSLKHTLNTPAPWPITPENPSVRVCHACQAQDYRSFDQACWIPNWTAPIVITLTKRNSSGTGSKNGNICSGNFYLPVY